MEENGKKLGVIGGHKYASGTNLQYPVDVNIDEILRDILEKMDNHIQSN